MLCPAISAQTHEFHLDYAKVLNNINAGGVIAAADVKTDAFNNVIVTGVFTGTADFDPGPGVSNLFSKGAQDIFLAKYDASGNFVFAVGMGGTENEEVAGLALDRSGYAYITGVFTGTVDFAPGADTFNLYNGGVDDTYFAKYSPSGKLVFAKSISGTGYEVAKALAVDQSGNLYLTGYCGNNADFDPGPGTATLPFNIMGHIFIARYNSSGEYLYVKGMSGTGTCSGQSIAVDATGNIFTTGYFTETIDFDPGAGTVNKTSAGEYDFYLARYDASGNYLSVHTFGGSGYDYANSVILDAENNIYLTGYFENTVDFNPGPETSNLTSTGGFNLFVAKYDVSIGYQFAHGLGAAVATGAGDKIPIALDPSGNIYLSGDFKQGNKVDFDPGPGVASPGAAMGSFLTKYSSSGAFMYVKTLALTKTGTTYNQIGSEGMATDHEGNIILAGFFSKTVDFDPGAATHEMTAGAYVGNAFLGKYSNDGDYQWANQMGFYNGFLKWDDGSSSITTDRVGNIYLTGSFFGRLDFDPGPDTVMLTATDFSETDYHDPDPFFAKYTADGRLVYVKQLHGGGSCQSVLVDSKGDIYVMGSNTGKTDLDPGENTKFLPAGNYMARYDAGGNFVNAAGIGNNAVFADWCFDPDGSICITGYLTDTADFDPGAGKAILGNSFWDDIFVARYTSSFEYVFTKVLRKDLVNKAYDIAVDKEHNIYIAGETNSQSYNNPRILMARLNAQGDTVFTQVLNGYGRGYSIATDSHGYYYVTGSFSNTVDFDPGPGNSILSSTGNDDIFLAKYDTSGACIFARQMGSTWEDRSCDLLAEEDGSCYIAGRFSGTIDLDPGSGTNSIQTSKGKFDIFLAKVDADGHYLCSFSLGGTESDDVNSIIKDAAGSILITGTLQGTVDFNPGEALEELTGLRSGDIFFAKYFEESNHFACIEGTSYGRKSYVNVSLSLTGSFGDDNVFTAQLSDASGNFENPVEIGSLTAKTKGTLRAQIPAGAAAGDGYLIRILSSNPMITGNTLNISIAGFDASPVTLNDFKAVCSNDDAILLSGGNPSGGIYSGSGVKGGLFYPAIAGPGTHSITYTCTDAHGCINSDLKTIVVNGFPEVSLADISPLCMNSPILSLSGGSPSGGLYAGTAVYGESFDPSAAGVGYHILTYTYADENNCSAAVQTDLVVISCSAMNIREPLFREIRFFTDQVHRCIKVTGDREIIGETFCIVNTIGQVVLNGRIQDETSFVDISGLRQGLYYLRLSKLSRSYGFIVN